jgi:TolA-binding protein
MEAAPDYPMISEVLGAWIESLLRTGREREARDAALEERDRWTAGDHRREPLDFLSASAAFRLGQYGEAGLEFEAYLFQYLNGSHRTEAAYSRAVCHLHQRRWQDARSVLDRLLKEDAAGEWTDGSLYYRAFCLTMEEAVAPAEADLEQLLARFPKSPHRGAALNLLGDLRFREKAWAEADAYYAQAESLGDPAAAAYGAYQRIRIALAQLDTPLALARYQAFREQHLESKELPDASVAVARVYESQGRAGEAVELLTRDILDRADRPRDAGLETLMHAHNALYKRTHGYQALIARLRAFPGPVPAPRPRAAWLALAEIEALESVGGEVDDPRIQERYRFLAVEYELDELDGIFVLKLARWLEQTGDVASAISYYTMLTRLRDEPAYLQQARIERARLLRVQPDPASHAQALDDLRQVLAEAENSELREAASVEIARHWLAAGEWVRARRAWEQVLAESRWLMARGEATYGVAFCMDQLDLRDQARRQYVNTYVHFEGQIDWSAPAFLRSALMAAEDGDPERARQVLDDMMARMGHLDHPVVNRARTLHKQWQEEGTS